MSVEDKVGQLLMPYGFGSSADTATSFEATQNQRIAGVNTLAQMVQRYHLGGFILLGLPGGAAGSVPTHNVDSPNQVATLTAGLQRAAKDAKSPVPLLIATDQEEGLVTRIGSPATLFPGNMALGATGDPQLAQQAARATGQEMRTLGVTMDLAPVSDVTAGSGNTVIGSRSFGSDAPSVSRLAVAAIQGYASAGVLSTAKHFPGHGNTDVDSHLDLPVLHQSLAQLTATDLAPFRAAISAGVPAVMVGHLAVSAIDPGIPADLSAPVVTGLLRTKMHFNGLVLTDALRMGAIANGYTPQQAAVLAVQAGDDLLVMPDNLNETWNTLLGAVANKTISTARLDASVRRILTAKLGLPHAATSPLSAFTTADQQLANIVAAKSITVVSGGCAGRLLPSNTVSVVGGTEDERTSMTSALRAAGFSVGAGGTTIALADASGLATSGAYATVALDTPYVLGQVSSPVRLAAYSTTPASLWAAAQVLAGKARAPGHLPVVVSGVRTTGC